MDGQMREGPQGKTCLGGPALPGQAMEAHEGTGESWHRTRVFDPRCIGQAFFPLFPLLLFLVRLTQGHVVLSYIR